VIQLWIFLELLKVPTMKADKNLVTGVLRIELLKMTALLIPVAYLISYLSTVSSH